MRSRANQSGCHDDRSTTARREHPAPQFVLFVCVVLFAVVCWNVRHSRTNWLTTFIVLILLAAVTAVYAIRGFIGSLRNANSPDAMPWTNASTTSPRL